jgi:hypothetical protein
LNEEIERKRSRNERKFGEWEDLPVKDRKYWYDVIGRFGFRARYIKEVDEGEETVRFYQEIYNGKGNLIEFHEKFPTDLGHRLIKRRQT